MRKPLLLVTPALLVFGLLAACSGDSTEEPTGSGGTAEPAGVAADVEQGAYPVTIEHRFGEVEIDEAPERVVALGYTEQDAIVAFGVQPVGVRYAFGPEDDPFFPWADEAAGDADPEILPRDEVDPEAVAELEPDLIMALTAGLTEEEYELYAQIAPTVVPPDEYEDFGVPWEAQTEITGAALGQPDRADQLVSEVQGQLQDARDEHPELAGRTFVLTGPLLEGQYPVHASSDTRSQLFLDLGMEVLPAVDEAAGDQFYGQISRELVEELDADVLLMQSGSDEERRGMEDDELLQSLDVAQDGRALFVEGAAYDALQFVSALSIPYLLDELLPQLAALPAPPS